MEDFGSPGQPAYTPPGAEASDPAAAEFTQLRNNAQPEGTPGPAQVDPNPANAQAPTWKGDEWAFKWKGQSITPRDKAQVVQLMQQGYDYNQAMNKLKQDRQALDEQGTKFKKYTDLEGQLASNPQFAQDYWNYVTTWKPKTVEGQPEAAPVDPRLEKVDALEGELNKFKAAQTRAEIDKEVAALKSGEYGKTLDWTTTDENGLTLEKQVLKFALDKNILNLDDALYLFLKPQNEARIKQQALETEKSKREALTRQGVVIDGKQAPVAPPKARSIRETGWNKLSELATNEFASMNK